MRKRLRQITFSSDFPDDLVWDDDGEVVLRTNGLNVALAVAELLRSKYMDVESPTEHFDHGWDLTIRWGNNRFWIQVTVGDPDDAIILTSDRSGLLAWLGIKSSYSEFHQILHDLLSADGRFHDIRWHPFISSDSAPGALSPTAEYPGPKQRRIKGRRNARPGPPKVAAETDLTDWPARSREEVVGPFRWTELPLGPVGRFFAQIDGFLSIAFVWGVAALTIFLLLRLGLHLWLSIVVGYLLGAIIGIILNCWFEASLFKYLKNRSAK
jgi:hypothetical protein